MPQGCRENAVYDMRVLVKRSEKRRVLKLKCSIHVSAYIAFDMSTRRDKSITSVIRTYGNRLLGFIRNRVGSEQDAEDILQDVWMSLNSVVDLEAIENISAWLFRNARNRIVDSYRKRKEETLDEQFKDSENDLLFNAEAIPDDEFYQQAFWEELMAALDTLPEKQREVFVQNELDGLTLQEIADEKGENLKTIISRKRYAVKHLRKQLQEIYNELNEL